MNTIRKRQTLQSWISDALNDPDKGKPCSHLSLVHSQGSSLTELHTKQIGPAMDIPAIAELFQGKANAYAQDLPGAQTFQLLAFYGTSEPEARLPFLVAGDQNLNGLATEASDARGEKQQGMRHLEAGMQLCFRQSHLLFGAMESLIEKMSRRESALVQENQDAMEIVKKVMLEQINTNHELELKRLHFERATNERNKLLAMAPALANTLLGTEVFPQSTEDTALLEAVAEHLTPESAQGIASVLPSKVLGPLMARFQKYQERKESEARRLKESAAMSTLEGEDLSLRDGN